MDVRFSAPLLIAALLVFARVTAVLAFVPLPYLKSASVTPRLVLSIYITLSLLPLWMSHGAGWVAPQSFSGLAFMVIGETAFGIALGVVVALLCELFNLAAQFLGLQAGYGYASTIDPSTEADSGVLLVLAQLGGWLLFVALGVDHYVYRALALSLEMRPVGAVGAGPESTAAVIQFGAAVISAAWRLSLPVIALLLLVDIALASLGKLHAQLQLLSMAFPAKMLLAITLLGFGYRAFSSVFQSVAIDAGKTLMRLAGA